MSSWAQGYVSDIPYTSGFYRELTPQLLAFATLLRGGNPPPAEGGFDFCELGCGQGFGTTLQAAAYPKGRFWGFDFNPGQVAHARGLAGEAELANVEFGEESFEDLAAGARSDLPAFDYIALHGIYSWVNAANQQAIVRFIAQRLKPGGVVYASYNCMPGWAQAAPLQRLMRMYADHHPGRSDRQVEGALAFASRLKAAEALYFKANPAIVGRLEKLPAQNKHYLAHEYLNEGWSAPYHADVARDMAAAKLSFIASATLAENFEGVVLSEPMRQVLAEIDDPVLAQTLRDYCFNQQFRRDIYVRGQPAVPLAEQRQRLFATHFVLNVPRKDLKLEFQLPAGKATGSKAIYEPIADALAGDGATLAQLLALPAFKGQQPGGVVQALALLIGSGQAHPMIPGADARPARRLNALIARRVMNGGDYTFLAAARLGSALGANMLHMAALQEVMASGSASPSAEALAPKIWAAMRRVGRSILKEGQPVKDDAEGIAEVGNQIRPFLTDTLPVWRKLGL